MDRGRSRRAVLAAVGVGAAGSLAGCTSREEDGAVQDGEATVIMTDEPSFDPPVVEVGIGDAVVWENAGSRPQTVTAYGDGVPTQSEYFASGGIGSEVGARILYPVAGGLSRGERYGNTFEASGTYRYFSIPAEDQGMTGRVVVRT